MEHTLTEKFFALIRYAVRADAAVPQIAAGEWADVYTMAAQQALLGMAFVGIERLRDSGEELTIPRDFLLKWIFTAEQVRQQNRLLNQRCVEVVEEYRKGGLDTMVLKGQGNATMYPDPLSRTPGDIDLLVRNARRADVVAFARTLGPVSEVRYHHAEHSFRGVSVEAHFMPGIMNNPWYNRRLQLYYREHGSPRTAELPDGAGRIPVPAWDFNVVFQLAHMMHHYFDEGIGLRQFVDYYYLLSRRPQDGVCRWESTLRPLGLWQFAGAVMYVESAVLGLDREYLVAPVDRSRGEALLAEILRGGNFGQYSGLAQHSAASKYFLKHWRSLRFFRHYPAESLSEPLFRTWHYLWRKTNR